MTFDVMTVVIVDDNPDARVSLRRQLEFAGIAVVGEALTGSQAIELALALEPDAVLVELDRNGLDGLGTVGMLAVRSPATPVVALAAGDELALIRHAMLAGARAYLRRPFVGDEAVAVIREVRRRIPRQAPATIRSVAIPGMTNAAGTVVAVTAAGGGAGRTTLAVNVAIAAQLRGRSTVIVDADLAFGDVGAMLDLPPNGPTMADLAARFDEADPSEVEQIVRGHRTGLAVVLGPNDPRTAVAMPADTISTLVRALARRYDAVIVDLPRPLEEDTLGVLDLADRIVVPFLPHAAAVHAVGTYLVLLGRVGLGDRIVPVLNRHDWPLGLAVADVERALGQPIAHLIAHDPRAGLAVNLGRPLLAEHDRGPCAAGIARLAGDVLGLPADPALGEPSLLQRAWQGVRGWAPPRPGRPVSGSNEMGHPSQYV